MPTRRTFLRTSAALAAPALLRAAEDKALLAYVGTFSSPPRDTLPTQVDLPPGNGRGIHLFQVDRASGAMTPTTVVEMGTSPSCLALNTVRSGGAGPTYVSVHPGGRHLLVANYFGGSVAVLPILANGELGDASDVKA